MFKSLYRLVLALALASPAAAVAPSTLGYQGRLATSGGQPISGIVSITFRLYDVASGGSALWTETQNNIVVDGGNLAIELGKVTPLPASVFGRQLYVGVQLAGDSEMLPRPPLTAAPFALRAGSTFRNTIFVPAEGTPTENGAALLAAATSAASATAQSPIAIELDAGTYDLGNQIAVVPPYVTLGGRSQEATTITSANPDTPVFLGSNTSAHDFTSRSTGTPVNNYASIGLIINGGFPPTPADNVRLERVTGIASAATGRHWGIYACAKNSHISDVTGIGQGGQFSAGLTLDCDGATNNIYEGIVAYASGASDDVTGVFIGGGGVWRDFKVFVTAIPYSTYGLRVIARNNAATALLSDVIIHADGDAGLGGYVYGVLIERANVDLERVHVNIDITGQAYGMNISAIPGSHVVRVIDSNVAVSAGGGWGISVVDGGTSQVSRTRVSVRCLANFVRCIGVNYAAGSQADALELDHVDVMVDNDVNDQAIGYAGSAARITNSKLHLLPGSATQAYGAWSLGGPLRISRSSLVVENTVAPIPACVVGTNGFVSATIELYGSHVQGQTCLSGPPNATCAGNTKRGVGFLASTCP